MFANIQIDLPTAARTEAPDAEVALGWRCPVCGMLRVFEGGRPFGSRQTECPQCGSPYALTPRRVVAPLDGLLL